MFYHASRYLCTSPELKMKVAALCLCLLLVAMVAADHVQDVDDVNDVAQVRILKETNIFVQFCVCFGCVFRK